MDDMRQIEDNILSELAHLGEKYEPSVAIKVLEMTQKEVHHRELIRSRNRLEDVIGELTKVLESKK